jgi:hypothetical protein
MFLFHSLFLTPRSTTGIVRVLTDHIHAHMPQTTLFADDPCCAYLINGSPASKCLPCMLRCSAGCSYGILEREISMNLTYLSLLAFVFDVGFCFLSTALIFPLFFPAKVLSLPSFVQKSYKTLRFKCK